MSIKNKLKNAEMFFNLTFDIENIKCTDIIVLEEEIIFKTEDNKNTTKFEKFKYSEIEKTISSEDIQVYCTNCLEGKELYLSLSSEENLDIPDKCKDCYPYDMEDSKPLNIRPNYKASIQE